MIRLILHYHIIQVLDEEQVLIAIFNQPRQIII